LSQHTVISEFRRKLHIAGEEAMGASAWEYLVPYQTDLGAALDALRRQVFASGKYVKPSFYGDVFDLPEPSSVDEHRAGAVLGVHGNVWNPFGP
jgi:hypothetical protein